MRSPNVPFSTVRYDDAVDLFTRYSEKKPNNSWGPLHLGLSAWKDGRSMSPKALSSSRSRWIPIT
jgi:hypothetical protein